MNAPLIILGISAMSAVLFAVIVDERPLRYGSAAVSAFLLAAFSMWFPIDDPLTVGGISMKVSSSFVLFGRSLLLGETNRVLVSLSYAAAGLFILAAAGDARKRFLSTVFIITACSAAALMVQPLLYSAIFLELAVLAGAVMLGHTSQRDTGAVFLVSIHLLAMIALLLTGWTLDSVGVTAGAVELAFNTRVFLGFSVAVIIGIPPFSIWMLKAQNESEPIEWIFTAAILQISGFFIFLGFVSEYSFLREDLLIREYLRIGGTVLMYGAGLWAFFQKKPERFLVFAISADLGVMMSAMSDMNPDGLAVSLISCTARLLSLILAAAGLNSLKNNHGERLRITSMVVLCLGFLSIAGFPLSPGFTARWIMIREGGSAGAAVFVSSLLVGLTAIRWVVRFIRQIELVRPENMQLEDGWNYMFIAAAAVHAALPQVANFWLSDLLTTIFITTG